jgi:uncharacterized protein YuzE
MAGMNLFDRTSGPTEFEYDTEADTLYVSFGSPRPAVGIDMGEGVIVRYDEKAAKVVGLTIVGIGAKVDDVLNRSRIGGHS